MSRSGARPSGAGPYVPSPPLPIWARTSSPDPPPEAPLVPSLGLHRATSSGNLSLVLYALENGQSPNTAIHGITPLHVAACMGNVATANLLMSFGADVNQPKGRSRVVGPGIEGSTPLHFAAANGHMELVRTLLAHGARPQPVDRSGNTPEMLASALQSTQCVSLLRQWTDMYGPDGHTDPAALQETYVWGDRVILAPSREGTPVTGALSPVLSGQGLRDGTPPHSPSVPEVRPRSSIPALIEKASHPASSLRAALFSSSASGRSDDASGRSSRLPTRASLTGLFRRGWPLADEEMESRSGRSLRPESVLSTRPRSSSKSSISTATTSTPPPSTPSQTTSAHLPPPVSSTLPIRTLLSSSPARWWPHTHASTSPETARGPPLAPPIHPSHARRRRSNSATQTRSGPERESTTRARAHSEVTTLPSLDIMVSSAWSLPPTPTPQGQSVPVSHASPSPVPMRAPTPGFTPAVASHSLLQALRPVARVSNEPVPSEAQHETSVRRPALPSEPLPALSWQEPPASDDASHSKLALYLAQVGSSMHRELP
ncbi:unnamed protein product [Malassezia sympodialis ATCC 42132]|uniref:Similar to S.cerevisiae protein HOS4 (Subunit of the Set3 complex) n=1 Tax=Malassezia sympodialis (strain ATCC 42132) TaxID=1230383 RepID=M5E734_MALS4|nr:uncharacterized protein MSY001_1007 [Malassezia sympodialis ATCC 42132]CCU98301.1 unnamed protein product [Malassezia sympodialis ATCC 42132]SHO75900.1 Similar to S.cerevisiae protein HOS4 (Subunit of the Set3 complex) [Malassezia sympodialis ATCC 42132]|eukprot:XP_018739616.1 uncharacterized protein MSY001_1007 [Malassezia sympodialis ATCC 42132]